ncbi:MAG TPA: chorismate synthase [Clostridiales bacterium]|nr:chorismate synthase [Clostridiales bacterium]
MNNTIGHAIALTLFGESHGEEIGAVIDGLAPGMPVDPDAVAAALARRRPKDALSTGRREPDLFRMVSGIKDGKTTGTPLAILIPNTAAHSEDYESGAFLPRPSHADYAAFCKYHGYEDRRGGGHFSGRLTAPLVAAGAILSPALAAGGVKIYAHIASLAGIEDDAFSEHTAVLDKLKDGDFPVLSEAAGEEMKEAIRAAAKDGDSVGGVVEVLVTGLPAGLGEPWFDTVEGELSKILFSVPAVKGVEFGDGFALAGMRGSEANDPFAVKDGKVVTLTNRNGGINGGITNGMPLCFSVAIKPTPSIFREQKTVNPIAKTEEVLTLHGRHDPAIVHRAVPVIEAVCAIVLSDFIARRYGTDALAGGRFAQMAKSEGCL